MLAFVMSIVWIWLFSDILVDIIIIIGIILNIRPAFLGLTVLAWGNSIGDSIVNVNLSKQGFSTMALTACYAGPLFNILFSFSIVCFKAIVENDGQGIAYHYEMSDL